LCFTDFFFQVKEKLSKNMLEMGSKSKKQLGLINSKKILQKYFLTRNMQVLIYGQWEGQTKNCKSFFYMDYYENEKKKI
jgi:hypothetical protein